MKTGWPPGLMQDDCKGLSRWLAGRIDSRQVVRSNFKTGVIMNENIKELYNAIAGGDKHTFDSYLAEKFAFLIIEECASIANAGIDPIEDHLIGNDILEHFGVERE